MIRKQSVKVEIDERDSSDLIGDTLFTALDLMEKGDDFIMESFFTVRFDYTPDGSVAATVTASKKR